MKRSFVSLLVAALALVGMLGTTGVAHAATTQYRSFPLPGACDIWVTMGTAGPDSTGTINLAGSASPYNCSSGVSYQDVKLLAQINCLTDQEVFLKGGLFVSTGYVQAYNTAVGGYTCNLRVRAKYQDGEWTQVRVYQIYPSS